MSTSAVPREFVEHDAPECYGKRRCSMDKKCATYEQTARWGEPEVGKVRSTKEAKGEGVADGKTVSIALCGLCERAFIASGKDIYQFTGIVKKGRQVSYYLPNLRRFRKNLLLTQVELSKRSGVGVEAIRKAEQQREKTTSRSAGKLARALGVEVKDLK